ncbi:MAG: hypothetical protein R3F49_08935 [Planctomycetota bacterium]
MRSTFTLAVLAALAALPLAGCAGSKTLADPIVRISTDQGAELGVSTNYGVVYLGRSGTRGAVAIEALFGDGPNLERSVTEAVGGGLFTARTEIELPEVPLSFAAPVAGEALVIAGRDDSGSWERNTRVVEDPRVFGLLVENVGGDLNHGDQTGAGVFRQIDKHHRECVGLVSGRVTLDGRTYLAVVGPEVTWRLVAHRRDLLRRKPWVYRKDIN